MLQPSAPLIREFEEDRGFASRIAPQWDSREPAFQVLREYAEFLEMPLHCVSLFDGRVLACTHLDAPPPALEGLLGHLTDPHSPRICDLSSGLMLFSLPLPPFEGMAVAAVGCVLSRPGVCPPELVRAATNHLDSPEEFERWFQSLPYCGPKILHKLLLSAVAQVAHGLREKGLRREIDDLAGHLEYTYEEICLLHTVTQNLQISRAPSELAGLVLPRLNDLIKAEGHVVWLADESGNGNEPTFLVEGRVPFDAAGFGRLLSQFEGYDWSRPLVKNRIRGSLLGADFPGLQNLVIVSISEASHRSGWLCSCNLSLGREFGTVEARLLSSVASIMGTHGRNIDLYRQHDELLLSFVRSLVSSLDAKDPYTRGHSERVARVARRIGEHFQLPQRDLQDIYLSGLLHDIGKIGIDDSILRKPGQLTPEEFDQIKKHPVIGYNILVGLKNLQAVIPGVRHHHEAYNGRGYPDGLAGDEIPFMARILAVADSYDAMASDRPYRKGMDPEILNGILRRGAGNQWDPDVVNAYFAVLDDLVQTSQDEPTEQMDLLPSRE